MTYSRSATSLKEFSENGIVGIRGTGPGGVDPDLDPALKKILDPTSKKKNRSGIRIRPPKKIHGPDPVPTSKEKTGPGFGRQEKHTDQKIDPEQDPTIENHPIRRSVSGSATPV